VGPRKLELVLVGGERRKIALPTQSTSIANVLARLDEWIQTEDGGWVHKRHIVEVRAVDADSNPRGGSQEEYKQLDDAAGELADQARGDAGP
jgi:hypothetical protein